MPKALSKWVRKKLSNETGNQKPPLPTLPLRRPTLLTPPPSQESLVSAQAPVKASSMILAIPFELRRMILMEAFGNQTVHMDLSCERPAAPFPRLPHAAIFAARSLPSLDESTVDQWRWWSSVCHHSSPKVLGTLLGNEAFRDCHKPGISPDNFSIGIMGWLLSCRQAYAEGIDVLYSTNTIHMTSDVMILHLPRLLLPQRLASITSVMILWQLHSLLDEPSRGSQYSCLSSFHQLLESIPLTFPHLKKMHLSLEGYMKSSVPDEKRLSAGKSAIILPVDDMVRRLGPHLKECILVIPENLYDSRKTEATGQVFGSMANLDRERGPLWRDLPETGMEDKWRDTHLQGYWVCLGQRDVSFTIECPMGRRVEIRY